MTSSKKAPTSSPTRRGWLGWAVAAAGLGAAGVAAWRFGATPSVPQPPSDWWSHRLAPPQGDGTVALETFRGKPLLVNFWATWCPPCIRELPLLDAFYQQHRDNGLQMLGIAVDRPEAVQRFLRGRPLDFPVLLAGDAGMGLAQPLGNNRNALPFSVLFNAEGEALEHRLGEVDQKTLTRWAGLVQVAKS